MTGADALADGDDQLQTVVQDDEQVSEAIVRLVVTVDGTDPLDLPPLGRVIDSDAIDALFESVPGSSAHPTRSVTVEYHGYTVTVDGTDTEQVCVVRDR